MSLSVATFDSQKWPLWWRIIALLNISVYNLLGNAFAAGVTPLVALFMQDLHCTSVEASRLATYALLALGISNILAILGLNFMTKRYIVLVTQAVFLAANIWAGEATSYNQLLATRFVGGLAAGAIEALGPVFIIETFSEGHLSTALVVYSSCLAMGAGLGPFFSGIIGTTLSWRWFFRILTIFSGVNLLTSILMLPETSDVSLFEYNTTESLPGDVEKPDAIHVPDINNEPAASRPDLSWMQVWLSCSFYVSNPHPLKVHAGWNPWKAAMLLITPPVFIAILVYAMHIAWSLVISIVIAVVFEMPPYLWTSKEVGFFGASSIIGIVIGAPVGGNLADYLSSRYARRNDGHHRPESRLPVLIIPALITPTGLIIAGVLLQQGKIWVGQAFGSGMLAMGASAAGSPMLTYAMDCFPTRSGEIAMLVNVFKNCFAFGLSFGTLDWYQKQGASRQFSTMAGLLWFVYLTIVPLYFFGSRIRDWSARTLLK